MSLQLLVQHEVAKLRTSGRRAMSQSYIQGTVLCSMKIAPRQSMQAGWRGEGGSPPAGGGCWPAAQALPHAAYPGALPTALPSDPTCAVSLPWSGPAPRGTQCCAGTVAKAAEEFEDACVSPLIAVTPANAVRADRKPCAFS